MTKEERRLAAFVQSNEALVRHMDSRSIAIVRFDGEPKDLGSGTCVAIGPRFFVLTAAHVIKGATCAELALIHARTPSSERVHPVRTGIRGGGDYDEWDLGWLEVSDGDARRIGKEFVPLSRLRPYTAHLTDDLVLLSGFPRELINQDLVARRRLAVQAIGCYSNTVASADWPTTTRVPTAPERDIFLDYPEAGIASYGGTSIKVPHPDGVSGGGIWAARINEGGFWMPDQALLMGIEYAWLRQHRMARGVQIQHALRMLAEDAPDVADLIHAHLASTS